MTIDMHRQLVGTVRQIMGIYDQFSPALASKLGDILYWHEGEIKRLTLAAEQKAYLERMENPLRAAR